MDHAGDFDPIEVTRFKYDRPCLCDYLNLNVYWRNLYQTAALAATVNIDHIRYHYCCSHKTINPGGVLSLGSYHHQDEPHGRDRCFERWSAPC
ncbi:Uncharacterized protein yqjG [Erwinia sp. Ejp617]|nr:hypothetical protein [Erwinia sp. Ejp617]ADP10230.1 Uncharacterized protein yqjG [Erwinia sp. Ejp617]